MTGTKPTRTLASRTLSSSAWLFGAQMGARLMMFVQVFVLARLLAPAQFGILALAFIALEFLRMFSDMGLEHALIQRASDISGHMNTAWTAQVIRGATLAGILFTFGPAYASFFDQSEAGSFIQAFALPVFVMGLANIGIVQFKKAIQYERLVIMEVLPQLLAVATTLILAAVTRSVWALFWGNLVNSVASAAVSYLIHPYRPRFRIIGSQFRELFSFSKWIYISTILLFALNQGDDIAVGRVEGIIALAFYQMGFKIARLPVTEINNTLAKVLFPAYAEIQDDTPRLREAYFKTTRIVVLATAPFSFGIFVIAPYAIPVLLGTKWDEAVELAQIFALLGLLVSVGSTTGSIFGAVGRPQISTQAQLVRAVAMYSLLFPFIASWGAAGAAWAVTISEIVISGYLVWRVVSILETGLTSMARAIWYQIVSATVMAGAVALAANQIPRPDSVVGVIALAVLGACVYATCLLILDRLFTLNIVRSVTALVSNFRPKRRATSSGEAT